MSSQVFFNSKFLAAYEKNKERAMHPKKKEEDGSSSDSCNSDELENSSAEEEQMAIGHQLAMGSRASPTRLHLSMYSSCTVLRTSKSH